MIFLLICVTFPPNCKIYRDLYIWITYLKRSAHGYSIRA